MTVRFPSELEANAWDRTLRECHARTQEEYRKIEQRKRDEIGQEQMPNDDEFRFMQERPRQIADEALNFSMDDLSLSGSTIYPS